MYAINYLINVTSLRSRKKTNLRKNRIHFMTYSGHLEIHLNFPLLEPVLQKIHNVNKSRIFALHAVN